MISYWGGHLLWSSAFVSFDLRAARAPLEKTSIWGEPSYRPHPQLVGRQHTRLHHREREVFVRSLDVIAGCSTRSDILDADEHSPFAGGMCIAVYLEPVAVAEEVFSAVDDRTQVIAHQELVIFVAAILELLNCDRGV